MFKCLFYFFALLSINSFSAIAMDKPEESGTIKVRFKNYASGLKRQDLTKLGLKFDSDADEAPYIISNPDKSDSFKYITDVNLMITLLEANGKSYSICNPIPIDNGCGVLAHEFSFNDRAKLNRITVEVQGLAYEDGTIDQAGKWKVGGNDHRCVVLGAAWHSLTPGTTGWLKRDSLYAYFSPSSLSSTRVIFGNSW